MSQLPPPARCLTWLAALFASVCLVAQPVAAATLSVLHVFNGIDGFYPEGGVVADSQGNVYGETFYGGAVCPNPYDPARGCGVVYKVSPAGIFTQLVTFNGANGADGDARLTLVGSRLYGSTEFGPANQDGTVQSGLLFTVNTDGSNFKVLHQFDRTDGANPREALKVMPDGTVYGTTSAGGLAGANLGNGVLFMISPGGTYRVLHSFSGFQGDGSAPGAILVAPNGTIYGSTAGTDRQNYGGTLYSYDPSTGVFATLKTLGASREGVTPELGGFAHGNTIVGTTSYGGAAGDGTLFEAGPSGFKVLWTFQGPDGADPTGAPLVAADGTVTGGTAGGGVNGGGTFYTFSNGVLTTIYPFSASAVTPAPYFPGPPFRGPNGVLYGASLYYGAAPCPEPGGGTGFNVSCGSVFSITP